MPALGWSHRRTLEVAVGHVAMPVVDAVLITYKNLDTLTESIEAVLGQSAAIRSVVVIDNNPTEIAQEQLKTIRSDQSEIIIAHHPANIGPAGGWSEGYRMLKQKWPELEWVLLLDDDDPLPRNDVVELLLAETVRLDSSDLGGIGLMGATFSPSLLLGRPIPLDSEPIMEVDYLFGWSSILYRAAALDDAGCCRPELFYRYVDLDQGLRLRKAGWKLYAAPGVLDRITEGQLHPKLVARPGTPRMQLEEPSAFSYYRMRNLVNIGLHYCRWRDVAGAVLIRAIAKPLSNLPAHPVLATRVLALNLRAVADAVRGRLGRNRELEMSLRPAA